MADILYFEFVCTGNKGRSPVAELIGRNHLRQQGLLGEFDTRSSGSHVALINEGRLSPEFKKSICNIALSREGFFQQFAGYVQPYDEQFYRKAACEGIIPHIDILYAKAINIFADEEHRHREKALKELGIEGESKNTPEQTVWRPDTMALFCMAQSNLDEVMPRLEGFQVMPRMTDLLARTATGYAEPLANQFGRGWDAYADMVKKLQEYVPKAIDCVLRWDL